MDAVSASSRVSHGPTYEWEPYEWELEQDRLEIAAVETRQGGKGRQGRPEGCWNCGQQGHIARACPTKKCFVCNNYGHSAVVCPSNPRVNAPVPTGPERSGRGPPSKGGKGGGGKGGKDRPRDRHKEPAPMSDPPRAQAPALPAPKPQSTAPPGGYGQGGIAAQVKQQGLP